MANVMTTIGNAGSSGVTVTSGAVVSLANDFGFTATQLVNAERALITATKAAVRYRYDGVAPTTEVGHLLPMDAAPPLEVLGNVNLKAMQFILDAGAAVEAIVLVTLEKALKMARLIVRLSGRSVSDTVAFQLLGRNDGRFSS